MEIIRYGKTCSVRQANTNKVVEAEVFDFKEHDRLTVVLNKTVKVFLHWNGRMYEGTMAGLDFITEGPEVKRSTSGR